MEKIKKHKLYILPSLSILLFGGLLSGSVSAATYYVSTTGADTNVGSQQSPFKTFAKAITVANPGDSLKIFGGTYTESLKATKSGTAGAPITISPVDATRVIIDNTNKPNVLISGSYINISGITAIHSAWACVQVTGNNINISDFNISECSSHGIMFSDTNKTSLDVVFENSVIHDTVTENRPTSESNSWGSAVKVYRGAERITIRNNTVYHNYGEGIAATRGKNITINNNRVYDNFSVNIYLDHSDTVNVEKNFITCDKTATTWFRQSAPATGILIGEEYYAGWDVPLANLTIKNNISFGCKGLNFYGVESGVVNPGLIGANISNNTIWGIYGGGSAIKISSQPYNSNIIIKDNIVGGSVSTGTGITATNNLSSVTFASTPSLDSIDSFRLSSTSMGYGVVGYQFEGTTVPPVVIVGDANNDKLVNDADYSIWLSNYKKAISGVSNGDFSGDSVVDGIDFVLWVNNYAN